MKLQNLSIIFLVIIIPLILILSYYLNLQQETLELQAEYDTKLAEATKEGVRAFEINTVDWADWVSYKTTTTQRKEVKAAVNAFISSLANNINVSGTAKEYMVNYIPAVVATMYDGYYVYSANYLPKTIKDNNGVQLFYDKSGNELITDSNSGNNLPAYKPKAGATSVKSATYVYTNDAGNIATDTINIVTDIENAEMEYKHILGNHIAYVEKYIKGNLNVVVNYTLDNRIYINGTKGTEHIEKDGYLVYFDTEAVLPRMTINTATPNNSRTERDITIKESAANTVYSKKITNTITNKTKIESEVLTEQIVYKDEISTNYKLGTFKYIYDIQHEKLYYDDAKSNFFTLQKDKTRKYLLNNASVKVGDSECRYKSLSVLLGTGETTEYKKIYQVLNGKDKGEWYIDLKEDTQVKEEVDTEITVVNLILLGIADTGGFAAIYKDFSAINYYVEAYAFTNWVKLNLGGPITTQELEYDELSDTYNTKTVNLNGLFNISATNDPEDEYSFISQHKRELMKNHITTNLNLAISNYSMGTYEFKVPFLTHNDWDQIFSNVSLITFFQGVPIGLKYYNNYAIATSTTNREYVDPGELYFSGDDGNYHRVYCEKCGNIVYTGYRSVEYVLKEYGATDYIYYYQHDDVTPTNRNSETACYYCVVNKANYKPISDSMVNSDEITYKQAKSYNEALARERYYQKEDIIGKIGVTITYHENLAISGEVTRIDNMPAPQEAEIGVQTQISTKKPTVTTSNPFVKYVFVGWAESADSSTIKYMPGDTGTFYVDTDLYAIWRISLSNLPWSVDYYWTADRTGFDGGWSCNSSGQWNGGPWASGVYGDSISYIDVRESTNGSKIQMVGNSTNPGKGAIWATFESEFLDIAQFQFDYEINKGDSLNAGGFMFNIKETATTLEGYMLSINFDGSFKSKAGTNGAIYKFKYNKGNIIGQPANNRVNVESIELIATLDIGTYDASRGSAGSGTITITVTDTGYVVKCSELSSDVVVPVSGISPNTFGFFSDHYSHSCQQIGYFKLDNIKVTVVRDR